MIFLVVKIGIVRNQLGLTVRILQQVGLKRTLIIDREINKMTKIILIIFAYAVVMLIGQKIDRTIENDRDNRIDIDDMYGHLKWG